MKQTRAILGVITTVGVLASPIALGSSSGASEVHQGNVINLTVYADPVRTVGFQTYQKMHPNIHFTIQQPQSGAAPNDLEEKTLLANRVGSGWIDISFIDELSNISELEFANVSYGADLTNLVPKSIVNGYPTGVLNPCYVNGRLYCLRNDNAQNVLWYNAPLMKQWGYSVPTTWAQYEALGVAVAKQHPGSIIGDLNGRYGLDAYFWPAECPYEQLVGNMKVRVDMSDSHCVQMAKMLDVLVKNGTVSTLAPTAASFGATMKKALLLPAADWFGPYVFDMTFKLPAKTWAAAVTPAWTATGTHWTGDEGGGTYMISKHCKNIPAALAAIEWLATNSTSSGFQASSVTTPAFGPALKTWVVTGEGGYKSYFASDPAPVITQMASSIWPGISYVGYDDEGTFNVTMTAAAAAGKTLVSELPVWQKEATQLLQAAGYTVVNS